MSRYNQKIKPYSIIIQGDADEAHKLLAKKLQSMLIERNIPGIVIIVGRATKRRGILVYVPINIEDENELKDIVNKFLIAASL